MTDYDKAREVLARTNPSEMEDFIIKWSRANTLSEAIALPALELAEAVTVAAGMRLEEAGNWRITHQNHRRLCAALAAFNAALSRALEGNDG